MKWHKGEKPCKTKVDSQKCKPKDPKWHNITKRNNMLLPLSLRHITKLIHRMGRWMAWNALYMTKLPQHPLRKIRSHVSLASDEARENGLLCERPDTLVALIRTLDDNIHLQVIQLVLDQKSIHVTSH
ncbi:hypothetical protein AAZV13_10G083800 [Glycine max]